MNKLFKLIGRIFLFYIFLSITYMQISNIPAGQRNIFSDKVYAQSSDKENQSEKEVAITIDDLPFVAMKDYELSGLKYFTSKLLNSLKENCVPAIGFVIEKQLYKYPILDGAE